jgi:hypothetical protein
MSKAKGTIAILATILVGSGVIGCVLFWALRKPNLNADAALTLASAVGLCVLVSVLLGALPLLISYVQTTAKDRQLQKLNSIQGHPIAETAYYQIAVTTLKSIRPARVDDSDYAVPIISFCVVVMFGCLIVFLGAFPEVDKLFERKTFLLGGTYSLTESGLGNIAQYQRTTLLIGSFAFIASYIYMLGRLLDRINNNDIYPISYYYYVARFVIAALVAMIFRHVISLFLEPGSNNSQATLLLIAFAIGFAPDLFIIAMLRRAFQVMKISGSQNDPEQTVLPTNMSLLMIEGLSREKIDRLTELGIDNAQVLASQNPLIIWPRLPYSLTLIVDWIAQAQLYRFTKENGTKALRAKGINNIYDLETALANDKCAQEIATTAGLSASAVAAHIAGLNADPSFRHLKEVREKL